MVAATPSKGRGTSAAVASRRGLSPWLAPSPGKRWTELFFLLYSPVWILWCLCILVPFKIYEVRIVRPGQACPAASCCPSCTRGCPCTRCSQAHRQAPLPRPLSDAQRLGTWGYNSLGPIAALPCVLLPPLLQPASERGKPLSQRFWVKANLWIAIYSFIGNYVWTHYFYRLLGAAYTFPAHRLNQARERNPPGEALVSSLRAATLLRCVTCPAPDAFCAAARKEQWAMLVALPAQAYAVLPRTSCSHAAAARLPQPA